MKPSFTASMGKEALDKVALDTLRKQDPSIAALQGRAVSFSAVHMACRGESPQPHQSPSVLPSPALAAPVLPVPSCSKSRMLPACVPTRCSLMGTSVGNSHTSGCEERFKKVNGFPFGCFLGVFTSLKKKFFEKKNIHFSLRVF